MSCPLEVPLHPYTISLPPFISFMAHVTMYNYLVTLIAWLHLPLECGLHEDRAYLVAVILEPQRESGKWQALNKNVLNVPRALGQ